MISRPILFNGEMVKSILSGAKTQTRRLAKLNAAGRVQYKGKNWHTDDHDSALACPIGQVGDYLWVRETFIQGWEANDWGDIDQYDENGNEKPIKTWYRADGHIDWEDADGEFCENTPWKPSIHMPRSASRIDLEITSVRVERLQAISEADALAEGIYPVEVFGEKRYAHCDGVSFLTAQDAYRDLWDLIYKSWDANPWVWAVGFKRIKRLA